MQGMANGLACQPSFAVTFACWSTSSSFSFAVLRALKPFLQSGLALAGSCQYLDAIRLDIWRATAPVLTDY
jgi:hypothetical protein